MKRYLVHFMVLLVSLSALSCSKNNPTAPASAPDQGKIVFAMDMADNIASGTITITKGALTHVLPVTIANYTGSVTFSGVQVGHWNIQVGLFDSEGVEIYSGTGAALVQKDQTTSVTVHVNPNTGNLEINVEVPLEIRGSILYRSAYAGLWIMNPDGSNNRVLIDTTVAGPSTTEGCNYRGGDKIVYVGRHEGGAYYCGVYMANLDGTGAYRLDLPEIYHPRWSWDGQKLAGNTRSTLPDPLAEVMTFNPDGTNVVTVGLGYSPVWTPDNRLVYAQGDAIKVMNPDGSGDQTVLAGLVEPFVSDTAPDSTVLFDAYDSGTDTHQQFTVRIDGSQLAQLTSTSAYTCAGRFNDAATQIVFERGQDEQREIWVMNADGSNPQQITNNVQLDEGPVFLFY